MAIWFNSEVKGFEIKNKRKLKAWINRIISHYNRTPGNINIIFVDDSTLLKINSNFLHHHTYTDIISFDYSNATTISGDIFISIERVMENSLYYVETFNEELKRVIIHGILHFLGFSDSTENEKMNMRIIENNALSTVKDLLITA